MKKLLLLIFIIFPFRFSQENIPHFISESCIPEKEFDAFEIIYPLIRSHEGSYVNHPKDKGKETYAGITRTYNPEWKGWIVIDSVKKCINVKRYTRIECVEPLVKEHYRNIWDCENLQTVSDINLAYYLFDMRIHHINSFKFLYNSALASIGYDTIKYNDGIDVLNMLDSNQTINALKQKRMQLFYKLVSKDPSQADFLKGWTRRAKKTSIDS